MKGSYNHISHTLSLFLIFTIFLSACSPLAKIQRKKDLLNSNDIVFSKYKKELEGEDFYYLQQQRPNKKFLGVSRIKLSFYASGSKGKETGFKRWLKNSLGEPPVYYDSLEAVETTKQLALYLNNLGYFNSKVRFTTEQKKKGINVTYHIDPAKPYSIRSFNYKIQDSTLKSYINSISEASRIKKGQIYNAYTFDKERERITTELQNLGYYYFSKEYIYYEIDSTLSSHQLDAFLGVKNVKMPDRDKPGEFIEEAHQRYHINKIFINPDFIPLEKGKVKLDTLESVYHQYGKNKKDIHYYFLKKGDLRIKTSTVEQSIYIKPEQPYIRKDVTTTYRNLTGLAIFKYANIQFNEVRDVSTVPDSTKNWLNCNIDLARAKSQSYSIEAEGTNTGGELGVGASLVYRNKNIFRGGETFRIRLKGAMEVQKKNNLTVGSETEGSFLDFNTFETGINAALDIPRFLLPVSAERFPKYYQPKTRINIGYNYQLREDYIRHISNVTFGYDWMENKYKNHQIYPFDISLIRIFPSPEFDSIIQSEPDPRLRNQYTNHLITAIKYSFTFNNQEINKIKNFIFFRGIVETSGNLMNMAQQLTNATKNEEGYYTLFGIRYSQYVRADLDFRFYNVLNKENRLVYRATFGLGIPYGNSVDLPFEKGFFVGGANGLRGWPIRRLGPGSYSENKSIDRIGDIKLEGNVEYRFPIYSFLKGGLFIDAGNIWLLNENETFQGGKFDVNTFISEIAIDAGIGFRFDFSFFIFRIDGAVPIRDPSYPAGDRWVPSNKMFRSMNWNFGIGYPF